MERSFGTRSWVVPSIRQFAKRFNPLRINTSVFAKIVRTPQWPYACILRRPVLSWSNRLGYKFLREPDIQDVDLSEVGQGGRISKALFFGNKGARVIGAKSRCARSARDAAESTGDVHSEFASILIRSSA